MATTRCFVDVIACFNQSYRCDGHISVDSMDLPRNKLITYAVKISAILHLDLSTLSACFAIIYSSVDSGVLLFSSLRTYNERAQARDGINNRNFRTRPGTRRAGATPRQARRCDPEAGAGFPLEHRYWYESWLCLGRLALTIT